MFLSFGKTFFPYEFLTFDAYLFLYFKKFFIKLIKQFCCAGFENKLK